MHDEDTPTPEDDLLSLLSSAPLHDDVLDGFVDGFGEEAAREILNSEDKLDYLREIALGVAPGAGWTEAATTTDEAGRLNLELLCIALEARVRAYPAATLTIESSGGKRSVTPSPIADVPDDLVAPVQLSDGLVRFAVEDLGLPPAISFSSAKLPAWASDLLGEYATETLTETGAVSELLLEGEADLAARYALGLWLYRWHPGTGDPAHPFDEALSRLELGALAWQLAEDFGTADQARQWLDGAGPAILRLAQRSLTWLGWRRLLADRVLMEASSAYVSALPDASDAGEVQRLHQILTNQDLQARQLFDGSLTPEDFAVHQPREAALVAGEGVAVQIDGGASNYDPQRVPPRSVMAGGAVSWQVIRNGENLELQVLVQAGENPVEELLATVICDDEPEQQLRLKYQSGAYSGAAEIPWPPEHIELHIHHASYPGEFRTESERAATLQAIEAFVYSRREIFGDAATRSSPVEGLLERPFLCELAAWYRGE